MHRILIRRIYAAPSADDGYRILVDRLWPRGIKKADGRFDVWQRDIAPSNQLRKSFAHQPERFPEFQQTYRQELAQNPAAPAFVRSCQKELQTHNITLLYAAKEEACNNAVVLQKWLQEQIEKRGNENG